MPHSDPDARRAYVRAWKAKNRARNAELNKYADAAIHANVRAAKYGAAGTLTAGDVREVLSVGACTYCGSRSLLSIDHVKPLHSGGENAKGNLVASCVPCNASKWRGSTPGLWSRRHVACIECGTDQRRHVCHGLCTKCYARIGWYVRKGEMSWPSR